MTEVSQMLAMIEVAIAVDEQQGKGEEPDIAVGKKRSDIKKDLSGRDAISKVSILKEHMAGGKQE